MGHFWERSAITNYSVIINQGCPWETKTYGDSICKIFKFKIIFTKDIQHNPLGNYFPQEHIPNIKFSEKLRYSTQKNFISCLAHSYFVKMSTSLLIAQCTLQTSSNSFFMLNYKWKVTLTQNLASLKIHVFPWVFTQAQSDSYSIYERILYS